MSQTQDARRMKEMSDEQTKRNRMLHLLKVIEENPGESQYRLSKLSKIPRSTLQRLLTELVEDMNIRVEDGFVKERPVKRYYVMKLTDYEWPFFFINELAGSRARKVSRVLARSTLAKGTPITVEISDTEDKVIRSEDELDTLIEMYS